MIVLVPTRGRPQNARRLVEAWSQTRAQAELVFCVDNDDSSLAEYLDTVPNVVVGERLRLGPTLNLEALKYVDSHDIIGFMGDDHVPRTDQWDILISGILSTTGVAYGNDLLQGENLPTAVFITSDIVKTLGYYCPPDQIHLFLDNAWMDWGKGGDCLHYLPDVIIEHVHPGNGKAPTDSSYLESGAWMQADGLKYAEYRDSGLLAADIEKIRALR